MDFENFLNKLEMKLSEKIFLESLEKVKKIDSAHYSKEILESDIKNIIEEYKNIGEKQTNLKNIQFLTYGNPEVVLRLLIESVRYSVNSIIVIEDFCLAQNKLIVECVKNVLKEMKSKIKIDLENLSSTSKIVQNSEKADKTICVGNINQYNRVVDEIDNLEFYPYNVFIVYSDSDEFEELKRKIFEYSSMNGYDMEILDSDIDFDEAIDIMNEDSYNFASVLFSKNKGKMKIFKDAIKAQYKIINENPFYKTQFKLEI